MMDSQIENPPFYSNQKSDIINRSSKIYEFVKQLVVYDRVKRKSLSYIVEQLPQKLYSKKENIQNNQFQQRLQEIPLNEFKQLENVTYLENKDQPQVEIPIINNSQSNFIIDTPLCNDKLQEKQVQPSEKNNFKVIECTKNIITETNQTNISLDDQKKIQYKQENSQYQMEENNISKKECFKNTQIINIEDRSVLFDDYGIYQENEESQNQKMNYSDVQEYIKNNNIKFNKDRVFLIVGDIGAEKSSFVQQLAVDKKAVIRNGQQMDTHQCSLYVTNGCKYIDTPGFNTTNNDRFEILLTIAKYLHVNKYKFQDIFTIYVNNNQTVTYKKDIAMISYTYLLYEIFNGNINRIEVEQLIEEYFQSSYLLNWNDCGFHQMSDGLSQKRALIFTNRDKAQDYYQQFNIYHIVVKIIFNKNDKKEIEEVEQWKMDFLREQFWFNQEDEVTDFSAQNEYIKVQEEKLFNKIDNIIEQEIYNQIQNDGQFVQNVLLLGKSQSFKSSLIEQLTSIQGLNGSGEQQMCQVCQMFPVFYNNIKYRFIDAQVYSGTEKDQDPFQSFKVIADFLRRNKILEFKILYMNSEREDDFYQILKQIFIFIQYIFDQDQSFVDSDFINDLYNSQSKQILLEFMKNKIIKINRINLEKFHPIIYKDVDQIINLQFFCNFFNDKREYISIDKQLEDLQQSNLFKGIELIEPISIEDKIRIKIEQQPSFELVENQQEYELAYQKMNEKYEILNQIQQQILKAKEIKDERSLIQLLQNKLVIIKNIKSYTFILVGQINQIKNVEEYTKLIQPSYKLQQIAQNKLQNDIQKHFITLKFQPILFETTNTSKNVLISRKQNYYAIYYHQLKHFIQNNNSKHLEILENLAKTKVIQEIILQQYLQQKYIELNYDRCSQEVIEYIDVFSQGINSIFGSGVSLYKYSTYFCQMIELSQTQSAQTIAQKKYMVSQWMDLVFASLSIGIDVYQKLQGSQRFTLNGHLSNFTILSMLFSFDNIQMNDRSIFGDAVDNMILLKYSQYNQYRLPSTSTYQLDQTIGVFFKRIIDDLFANQSLLYFQKFDFLRSSYKISKYTQLKQKEGYEMFRKLEECQYNNSEQKLILQKLFEINQDNLLCNSISYYIASNIICQQLQLQEYNDQNLQEYLPFINNQMKSNQQIIETFFYSLSKSNKNDLNKSFQQAKKMIENKIKILEQDKNKQIYLNEIEKNLIYQYRENIIIFRNFIQENKFSYYQYNEFGNGFLSRNNHFLIIFDSYCNLMQDKTSYLFNQQNYIIKELKKDNNQKCLQLNTSITNIDTYLKCGQDYQNLIISENYCASKYLQKIKGEVPNLTYISQLEIIGDVLDYSIDLQELAEISKGFEDFVNHIKNLKKEIKLSYNILKRLNVFFCSFIELKILFK